MHTSLKGEELPQLIRRSPPAAATVPISDDQHYSTSPGGIISSTANTVNLTNGMCPNNAPLPLSGRRNSMHSSIGESHPHHQDCPPPRDLSPTNTNFNNNNILNNYGSNGGGGSGGSMAEIINHSVRAVYTITHSSI
jgi:hypothetical protein